jgi:hypothetical protein
MRGMAISVVENRTAAVIPAGAWAFQFGRKKGAFRPTGMIEQAVRFSGREHSIRDIAGVRMLSIVLLPRKPETVAMYRHNGQK